MTKDKKKVIWKRWWFITLVSILFTFMLASYFLLKDVEAQEAPEHLRYEYPTISDEDNIYLDLVVALKDLENLKEQGSTLNLESDDLDPNLRDEHIRTLEKDMPESVRNFRKQISKKNFYLSEEVISINDVLGALAPLRFFYKYECLAMHNDAGLGDWDTVNYRIVYLNQLYNKVYQVNTLIEGLVFRACRGIQLAQMQSLLDSYKVPEETIKLIFSELESNRTWESLAEQSLVAELNFMKLAAIEMKEGGLLADSSEDYVHKFVRQNKFTQGCYPYFDFWVRHISTPSVDIPKPSPLVELKAKKEDYLSLLINREEILYLMIFPALDKAVEKFRQISGLEDMLRLRVAALLYHREHKKLPGSIQDLIPQYLNEVPKDVYCGKEINYDVDNSRFYFCGPDLKDDNGEFVKGLMHNLNYDGDIVQYIFPQEEKKMNTLEKSLSHVSKFSKARLNYK